MIGEDMTSPLEFSYSCHSLLSISNVGVAAEKELKLDR
jgi:hypothetical protein